MTADEARRLVESAFERVDTLNAAGASVDLRRAIETAIGLLDRGQARVAEPGTDGWRVNEWLKKAVLLYFRLTDNRPVALGALAGYDKVPLKYSGYRAEDFARDRVRIVPPAAVRRGAYVAPDVVLMPCYVNIGAYIGGGSMIDTWATVGSCAQIGERVHISGGAGIGGVLEPLQATPTIVEDDCFIGARAEIVEGVVVQKGAVVAMGTFIGRSTRIYDRASGETSYGRIPAGAVVVPGSLPAADGSHNLACAVVVKRVDAATRERVGINALLREAQGE